MVTARLLTDDEFAACFAEPMRDVTAEGDAKLDIWPYIDALDLDALRIPHVNEVHYVYRDANGHYDQVLLGTGRFNTLLVVVVDRRNTTILGHHLLDLNRVYGDDGAHVRPVD